MLYNIAYYNIYYHTVYDRIAHAISMSFKYDSYFYTIIVQYSIPYNNVPMVSYTILYLIVSH